jgi:hypothetical protein
MMNDDISDTCINGLCHGKATLGGKDPELIVGKEKSEGSS